MNSQFLEKETMVLEPDVHSFATKLESTAFMGQKTSSQEENLARPLNGEARK